MNDIQAPVLLINAPEEYTLGEPLLPPEYARETLELLPNARLVTVAGNHQTMLYGEGAEQISEEIIAFAAV
jgi:pimeloyl-ACP methyl ester carboxylesterase